MIVWIRSYVFTYIQMLRIMVYKFCGYTNKIYVTYDIRKQTNMLVDSQISIHVTFIQSINENQYKRCDGSSSLRLMYLNDIRIDITYMYRYEMYWYIYKLCVEISNITITIYWNTLLKVYVIISRDRWMDFGPRLYDTITFLSWNRLHCVVRNFFCILFWLNE